jgi:hypothetical protein
MAKRRETRQTMQASRVRTTNGRKRTRSARLSRKVTGARTKAAAGRREASSRSSSAIDALFKTMAIAAEPPINADQSNLNPTFGPSSIPRSCSSPLGDALSSS